MTFWFYYSRGNKRTVSNKTPKIWISLFRERVINPSNFCNIKVQKASIQYKTV